MRANERGRGDQVCNMLGVLMVETVRENRRHLRFIRSEYSIDPMV